MTLGEKGEPGTPPGHCPPESYSRSALAVLGPGQEDGAAPAGQERGGWGGGREQPSNRERMILGQRVQGQLEVVRDERARPAHAKPGPRRTGGGCGSRRGAMGKSHVASEVCRQSHFMSGTFIHKHLLDAGLRSNQTQSAEPSRAPALGLAGSRCTVAASFEDPHGG